MILLSKVLLSMATRAGYLFTCPQRRLNHNQYSNSQHHSPAAGTSNFVVIGVEQNRKLKRLTREATTAIKIATKTTEQQSQR